MATGIWPSGVRVSSGYALLRIMYRAGIRTCRDLLAFPPRELDNLLASHNYRYSSAATSSDGVSRGQGTLDFYGKGQASSEERDHQTRGTGSHKKSIQSVQNSSGTAGHPSRPSSPAPQLSPSVAALRLLCSGDENEPVVATAAPKSLSAEDSYVQRGVRTPGRLVFQLHRLLERVLNRHAQHLDMYGEQATVFKVTIR